MGQQELRCFEGIKTLTAMLLIAQITDFRRFPNLRALMAFLGLLPSENSSGDKQGGGPISKAGNSRSWKHLMESVQDYVKKPYISDQMKDELSPIDPRGQ